MKKRVTVVIVLLCVMASILLAFVACDGNASTAIKGIDGGKDFKIDSNAKTIAFTVDCLTGTYAISKFKVDKGVTVKAYYDADKKSAVGNELQLEFGNNIFYIVVSAKKSSTTYKATIKRERPDSSVDSTKTVKSIEVAQAKTTYYVGESFSQGVLKVTYTDNSTALVTLTSSMVSGFSTAKKGDVTVTVSLGDIKTTYKIKVVEATVPQYPQVTPAQLNSNLFADTVCKWYAMLCTMSSSNEYWQEAYNLEYERAKAEYFDDFVKVANNFAKCGLSTQLLKDIDKYISPIFTDIKDIVAECDGKELNETMSAILNKERLVRIKNNGKSLLSIIKPEYLATLVNMGQLDAVLSHFINFVNEDTFDFAQLSVTAKEQGLNEVAQLLSDLSVKFANQKFIGAFVADYNSAAFLVDTVLDLVDTLLDVDVDSISSAVSCVADIVTMDEKALNDLIAGKGKYSYRDIINHANTVGNFLYDTLSSVKNFPIVKSVAKDIVNKVFNCLKVNISDAGVSVDIYGEINLYKGIAVILRDLTVADITDIYLDFNDWQVANNNNSDEDICNAKFATLIVRIAKILGNALDSVGGDRDSIAKAAWVWFGSFIMDTTNISNYSEFLNLIDKAADVEDPAKMSSEQALEFYNLLLSGLDTVYSDRLESRWNIYEIKAGTSKADFVDSLQGSIYKLSYDRDGNPVREDIILKASHIGDFDSSTIGLKTAKITYDNLSLSFKYYVYSSETADQMLMTWLETGISARNEEVFDKDEEIDINYLVSEYPFSSARYTYIDKFSSYRVEVRLRDCENLRVVGLDTSKVGEGVAYLVGEHYIMGKQVFPFKYVVVDESSNIFREIRLRESKYRYIVGEKFEGVLDISYYGAGSQALPLEEKNLSYDFSTPGFKTVTYTYEGKKYTCNVCVYSKDYATSVRYFNIYDMNCIKGTDTRDVMFGGGSIEFEVHDPIRISYMTIAEIKAALKAVDSRYDITFDGFNTNQEAGEYTATAKITRGGKVICQRNFRYTIILPQDIEVYDVSIVFDRAKVGDKNMNELFTDDLESYIKYIELGTYNYDYGYIYCGIYLKSLDDLNKVGVIDIRGIYGSKFTDSNGNTCEISFSYYYGL